MHPFKFEVRGGNSASYHSGIVWSDDSNGCPRRVLLRHHKVESPPGPRTKLVWSIGRLNEDQWTEQFKAEGRNPILHDIDAALKEPPGTVVVLEGEAIEPVTPLTRFYGHVDHVLPHERITYEQKSVSSTNVFKKVIVDGHPKHNNVCQAANYLYTLRYEKAILRYRAFFWHRHDTKAKNSTPWRSQCGDYRDYDITFDNDGLLLIDGSPSGIELSHLLQFRELCAYLLENNEVFRGRPQNPDKGGFDPCGLCTFLPICDKFDAGLVRETDEFVRLCTIVATHPELEDEADLNQTPGSR